MNNTTTKSPLFEKIGGNATLSLAVNIFYMRASKDDILKHLFENEDIKQIKVQIFNFLGIVLGSEVNCTGKQIKDALQHLKINSTHFNALVGHLNVTLDSLGIAQELIDEAIDIALNAKNDIINDNSATDMEDGSSQNDSGIYQELLQEGVDAVVTIDETKKIIFWNKAAEKLWGYSAAEVMGKNIKHFVPDKHKQSHDSYINNNINTGINKIVGRGREEELQRKDGSLVSVSMTMTKVNRSGKIYYMATLKDITEEKQLLMRYEQTQREMKVYRSMIDTVCLVSEVNLKGHILEVNDKFCEVGQYSREELIGQNHNIVRHPDMPKSLFKEMWSTIGRGKIFNGRVKNKKKDGSPYYVDGIFAPVLGDNGKPAKYIGIRYDITEATYAAQEAQAVVDAVNTSYVRVEFDTDGYILNGNQNLINSLGYNRLEDIKGLHHSTLVETEQKKSIEYAQFWKDLKEGQAQVGEFKRISKQGHPVWLQAAYTPVKNEMGEVIKIIKIATDITNQKQMVTEVNKVAEELAKGNLTEHFALDTAEGDMKELGESLNTAIASLNLLLTEVSQIGNLVAASAEEMLVKGEEMKNTTQEVAAATQQMAEGTQEQAEQTDQASKLMDDVLESANAMAEKSDLINKAAEDGQKNSIEGLSTIKMVVENMSEIQASASSTSESITVLSERSEEITSALSVITDIAAQTNLLALNAAIEAARAGDAGRGFAVVAEEIRKLAEVSRTSAIDIEKVIREVQKDIILASKAIDAMESSVKSGTSASKEAEEVFENIEKTSNQTLDLSKDILDATEIQKESINTSAQSIEKIVVVAEETASGTEQVASSSKILSLGMNEIMATSEDLANIANQLQSNIDKFKLA